MILHVENLSGWYEKEKYIIKNINLNVDEGNIYAILGANGAGKTTFLNIITSIHNKFSGEIYYCGEKFTRKNDMEIKRKRYFISDHPELFDEMTPMAFIEFVHRLYNKTLDLNKLQKLSEKFEFVKYLNQKINTLSLGNRQKTTIINALLLNCPLLIMDEPLVGLDVISIENLYKELKNYIDCGNSVLLSTHLFEVVESVCDYAFILNNGEIKDIVKLDKDKNIKEKFFQVIGYE